MSSEAESTPTPSALAAGGQPDLAALRAHVTALLDDVVDGGRLVDLGDHGARDADGPTAGAEGTDGFGDADEELVGLDDEGSGTESNNEHDPREALEVTDEQLQALESAHDALAEALQTLDSGRA